MYRIQRGNDLHERESKEEPKRCPPVQKSKNLQRFLLDKE